MLINVILKIVGKVYVRHVKNEDNLESESNIIENFRLRRTTVRAYMVRGNGRGCREERGDSVIAVADESDATALQQFAVRCRQRSRKLCRRVGEDRDRSGWQLLVRPG